MTTRPTGTFHRDETCENFPLFCYTAEYNGETFSSSLLSEIWEWAEDRGIILMKVE